MAATHSHHIQKDIPQHFGLGVTEFPKTLKMDKNIPLHFIHVSVKNICFPRQSLAMYIQLALNSDPPASASRVLGLKVWAMYVNYQVRYLARTWHHSWRMPQSLFICYDQMPHRDHIELGFSSANFTVLKMMWYSQRRKPDAACSDLLRSENRILLEQRWDSIPQDPPTPATHFF